MKHLGKFAAAASVAAFGLGSAAVATSSDAAAEWKPRKPIEFVIMAGKGGGADRLARFIQGIPRTRAAARAPRRCAT